jgi:hypothetical protein
MPLCSCDKEGSGRPRVGHSNRSNVMRLSWIPTSHYTCQVDLTSSILKAHSLERSLILFVQFVFSPSPNEKHLHSQPRFRRVRVRYNPSILPMAVKGINSAAVEGSRGRLHGWNRHPYQKGCASSPHLQGCCLLAGVLCISLERQSGP